MHQNVNISKVIPPLIPKIIHRPRLTDLLANHRDRKLIFIKGQAAQGKTTLAASYVESLEPPSVWVMLEPEDSEPINLYYSLVQALQYSLPEIDCKPLFSYPAISVGPRQDIPLYREWAHVIFKAIHSPLHIVIDDLHSLPPESPSLHFLNVLITEAPAEVRFIMISREEPPLGLQKKKIRQTLFILSQDQLAFTTDEIDEFFEEICGISLSSKIIHHIHNFSEGWIGGLVFLSDHLKIIPVERWEKSLTRSVPNRFREEIFHYFGEEIFNTQSASIQNALLKLAIFDAVDQDVAQDILSDQKEKEILDTIVKLSLFVTNFYDKEGQRTIRFHHLFQEFLRTQLKSRVEAEERHSLYIQAGKVCERRNDFETAIKFYLKAKEYPKAASAIERVGKKLVQMNRMADLSRWLHALPGTLIEENPWLLYYRSITVRFMEPKDNIQRLHRALTLFTEIEDIGGQLLVLGLLIESSFFAGEDVTPMSQLIERSEMLLESIGTEQYVFEKAALLLPLGFVYPLRAWNSVKGCWANQNAYLIFKQLGILPLQIYALSNLFLSQQMLGNYADAEQTRQKIEHLLKKQDYPEMRNMYAINLGQYYTVKGDLEKALENILSAKKDAEELGLPYLYFPLLIQELMLRPHLGQFEIAEQIGEQLLQFTSTSNNIFFKGVALLFMGANLYQKGDYVKAMELGVAAKIIFSSKSSYSLTHIVTANLILGLLNIHLGQYEDSQKELDECFSHSQQVGRGVWAAHMHFSQALLYRKSNQTGKAIKNLCKGMKEFEEGKHYHMQWMSRKDFTEACLLTLELQVDEAMDYAEYLLATHLGSTAVSGLERLMQHSDKTITEKAFAIRKRIYRSKLPHLRLQTLGSFEVFKDNEPMKEMEWQRNQAKMLLKAIISRGSRKISKDCIIEDLWPEVAPATGEKRFKVALYRLRKSLEPSMYKEFGSSYIHLADNLISLDDDLCMVDVDHFTSYIIEGNTNEKAGEYRKTVASLQKAIELYNDDFLPQDLYSDWMEPKRTELKIQYIDTLLRLGEIYENRGAVYKAISCYKKVIEVDSLFEEAYQRLMLLYSQKGKTNQALQLYEKLQQTLKNEIQSEPEPVTKKLYQEIIPNLPDN